MIIFILIAEVGDGQWPSLLGMGLGNSKSRTLETCLAGTAALSHGEENNFDVMVKKTILMLW